MSKIEVHVLTLALLITLNIAIAAPIQTCNQTPYPKVCSSMISPAKQRHHHRDASHFGFRNSVIRATMDQAIRILRLASSTHHTSHVHHNMAWNDCLELYRDMIALLNLSMAATATQADTQAWLSAASTDHEACRDGFSETNSLSTFRSSPFYANDIWESIGNALAINQAILPLALPLGANRAQLWSRMKGVLMWLTRIPVIHAPKESRRPDLVVAQDGTGDHATINEAVRAASVAKRKGSSRFVIHVKAGTYKEYVTIPKSLHNLTMIGDGINKTIVAGNRNKVDRLETKYTAKYGKDQLDTKDTATFNVEGWRFIAMHMTFSNTAGPEKHQAVALRSESEYSVYYRCSFEGYQDTLYVHNKRQFYRECDIYGTVDFIFGNAQVVFQNCSIYVRKPLMGQQNIITAQSKERPNENTGIVIQDSVIAPADDLAEVPGLFRTYLGRPWKNYSTAVVMKTELGSLIDPAGWREWNDNAAPETLTYREYMNTGPGASTHGRVKWRGYHGMSESEANLYTVYNFFNGQIDWIRESEVPFKEGLY